ncbi:MAG: primosomal protein N' [Proteobacteria bacterium]|nr:primosomal protein N' [Pseudomonadota bacterium]MBU1736800.1 primosomal protein N' [Pseudomonadota bacterium]
MSQPRALFEIAVAAPIDKPLTYLVKDGGTLPAVGCRVLVPLGRRKVTGYVLGPAGEPETGTKLKSITELLDASPLFPESMVELFRWTAEYYRYPIGEVIRAALPSGLTTGSGRQITVCSGMTEALQSRIREAAAESWAASLTAQGYLSPSRTRKVLSASPSRRLLEKWQEEGLVSIEEIIIDARVGSRTEICVTLTVPDDDPLPEGLKKSELKTIEIIRTMTGENNIPVARASLATAYSGARQALKTLAEKSLVQLIERVVYRDPFGEQPAFFPKPTHLTPEQDEVLAELAPALKDRKFAPFLLHGITGSGKTEVYLRAAETVLAAGRSVMVLVPEIALATQLEAHFISRFGDRVGLLHSGLSAGQRFDQWQRLANDEAPIVIGARSAVFAPLKNPGLIIVDEEHDTAYKQEDGLRYNGRDLAIMRASLARCPVILGSATPSVISYRNAETGKYTLLTMKNRVEERALPNVEIIDLQKIKTVSGRPPLFSGELNSALKKNLKEGNQSLVFLNRRGYANMVLCRDCGQAVRCPECRITLTLHRGRQSLICHYCGHSTHSNTVCGNCQSTTLLPVGFGTERLEDELVKLFPTARIARLDTDTTARRQDFISILKGFHERKIDILVGTQMITKGHHFPHVTLVGVVWADAGLGIPDFRSGERTFQLLSQVTGRAGRGEKPGRVIIQTMDPDHYSISTTRVHDYISLYNREMAQREALKFPPFSRLINLRIEGQNEEAVRRTAKNIAMQARKLGGRNQPIDVLGPAPAPLSRLHGRHRWQVLLKGSSFKELHALCNALLERSAGLTKTGVKLSVDVDPENML